MDNGSSTIPCPAGPVVLVSSAPLQKCLDPLANAAIAPTEHNRDQGQICKKIKVPKEFPGAGMQMPVNVKGEEIQMGRDMRGGEKGKWTDRDRTLYYIGKMRDWLIRPATCSAHAWTAAADSIPQLVPVSSGKLTPFLLQIRQPWV